MKKWRNTSATYEQRVKANATVNRYTKIIGQAYRLARKKVGEGLKNRKRKLVVHDCTPACRKYVPATINRYTQILGHAFELGKKRVGEGPRILFLPENNARQGFFEYGQFLKVLEYLPT